MRSLAKLVFAFLGISLVASAFKQLGRTQIAFANDNGELFYTGVPAAVALVLALVFMVGPGVFLVARRERLSRWLVPEGQGERGQLEPFKIYCLGLCLLGLYFTVSGASSTLIGVVQFVSLREAPLHTYPWGFGGLVELGAGVWLYRVGRERLQTAAGGLAP